MGGIADALQWLVPTVVALLVPVCGRIAYQIHGNSMKVVSLQSHLNARDRDLGNLEVELRAVHQRVSGIGRTTDHISGQMKQVNATLAIIQEHLLQRKN